MRTQAARAAIEKGRALVLAESSVSAGDFEEWALLEAQKRMTRSLASVLNASGVILHTGAGRARLAQAAAAAVTEVAGSHSAVELDMETGRRGDRQDHVRSLLRELTGAEDALVVNNNAGAVFLTLAALASGREVILSRGEMVEIGGSFRMPDIVRESGCQLVEVGCTNRTRVSDYELAITDTTAVLLRCHPSNFKMVGFVESVSGAALASLAHQRGLHCIDDVGSGCLVDLAAFGLPHETTLHEAIEDGATVVTASGDKLLGGPQAGLILGKHEAVAKIKRHPLARALRCDKLTLAALEATLRLYSQGREAEIPVIRYLSRPLTEIKALAESIASAGKGELREAESEIGGGSVPGTTLPTWCACLPCTNPEAKARELRLGSPAILARVQDGAVFLDPRTLEHEEAMVVSQRVSEVFA